MDIIEENSVLLFNSIIEPNNVQLTNSLTIIMNFLEPRMSKSGLNLEIKPIDKMVDIFASLNPLLTSSFKSRIIEQIVLEKDSHLEEQLIEPSFKDPLISRNTGSELLSLLILTTGLGFVN